MIIAVDFDGTIVTHEYPNIGSEVPFATDVIKRLQRELGHQIILWTSREGKYLEEAVKWCQERGVSFYAINHNHPEEKEGDEGYTKKIIADIYIDDRNLNGGTPNWSEIYQQLSKGKTVFKESKLEYESNLFIRFGLWIEKIRREVHKYSH